MLVILNSWSNNTLEILSALDCGIVPYWQSWQNLVLLAVELHKCWAVWRIKFRPLNKNNWYVQKKWNFAWFPCDCHIKCVYSTSKFFISYGRYFRFLHHYCYMTHAILFNRHGFGTEKIECYHSLVSRHPSPTFILEKWKKSSRILDDLISFRIIMSH